MLPNTTRPTGPRCVGPDHDHETHRCPPPGRSSPPRAIAPRSRAFPGRGHAADLGRRRTTRAVSRTSALSRFSAPIADREYCSDGNHQWPGREQLAEAGRPSSRASFPRCVGSYPISTRRVISSRLRTRDRSDGGGLCGLAGSTGSPGGRQHRQGAVRMTLAETPPSRVRRSGPYPREPITSRSSSSPWAARTSAGSPSRSICSVSRPTRPSTAAERLLSRSSRTSCR